MARKRREDADEAAGPAPEDAGELLRFLNQPLSAEEMAAELGLGGDPEAEAELAAILGDRSQAGGMFESVSHLAGAVDAPRRAKLKAGLAKRPAGVEVALERTQFRQLLLKNPNYFGNLGVSPFKPEKPLQGDVSFEELMCVGLDPPFDRLEGVIQIKRTSGYGGDVCTAGSYEWVRFFVDLYDDGVWHDVGLACVNVHDVPGPKPLCYAVQRNFSSYRKFCLFENIVRVRAILQWDVPPPPNPNFVPVWGNVFDVEVQIQPQPFFLLGDLFKELVQIPIPDPIGPVIEELDPTTVLPAVAAQPLTLLEKQELYADKGVPLHRFAFQEAQQLLLQPNPNVFAPEGSSGLVELGLEQAELADLVGKLIPIGPVDGDTSFEELRCVGLYPESDLLEAVLTVKKSTGYSGSLCGNGSTEYVAMWVDFGDGNGFQYMGTPTVNVHDLQTIPADHVQYAVFLQKDLSQYRVPCEAGSRVVRLRAILSWETPPPPANPNYVPVWGNRKECRVQLRPGPLVGHVPVIDTIGDIAVAHINQGTGLATGQGEVGFFNVLDSPFGGEVTITGEIGDPPDSYQGGLPDEFIGGFKYRIQVFGPPPFNTWQPLTDPLFVDVETFTNGAVNDCPGLPGIHQCQVKLTPVDDGDLLGPGWYEYLDDHKGSNTRTLIDGILARWQTSPAMEGQWHIRLDAKIPGMPPVLLPGIGTVTVQIDNTPPSGPAGPTATQAQIDANPPLTLTGAIFKGNPLPAIACGQFPVGTILSGEYHAHDPGLVSPDQHYNSLSLAVIPVGPAHGAAPTASTPLTYPVASTNGVDGTWTLDTSKMDPCGYVIRLTASDRTNYDSRGYLLYMTYDVGFCLVED
jgi:hypothetical protein